MQLQKIVKMPAYVSTLFALCFVGLNASAIRGYFFEPVVNITAMNQEVKLDGCATPTMTLAFNSAINVCFHTIMLTNYFR